MSTQAVAPINFRLLYTIYKSDEEGVQSKKIKKKYHKNDIDALKYHNLIVTIPDLQDMRRVKLKCTYDGKYLMNKLRRIKIQVK